VNVLVPDNRGHNQGSCVECIPRGSALFGRMWWTNSIFMFWVICVFSFLNKKNIGQDLIVSIGN